MEQEERNMTLQAGTDYNVWINWNDKIVSFHEEPGFERLPFGSRESWNANIRILLTEGFRFQ